MLHKACDDMEKKLRTLHAEQRDTLADRFRSAGLRGKDVDALVGALSDAILLLPAGMKLLAQALDRDEVGSALRTLAQGSALYMINARDFLSEKTYGFFGYLDDTWFIHRCVLEARKYVPARSASPLAARGVDESARHVVELVGSILPKKVLSRVEETFEALAELARDHNERGEVMDEIIGRCVAAMLAYPLVSSQRVEEAMLSASTTPAQRRMTARMKLASELVARLPEKRRWLGFLKRGKKKTRAGGA